MRGNLLAAAAAIFVAGMTITGATAQQAAPKAGDPDQVNAPEQLRGKSIVIDYVETRTARPDGGGASNTRRVPFQLVVYISTENRAFNRLSPGRAGHSDQVKGAQDVKGSTATKDITNFATRDVAFDGPKMTVTNNFGRAAGAKVGGTGKREITATFDEKFAKCTANVVVTIDGEFVRRRLMKGGFEELLSARNDNFACKIRDGNALIGSS